MTGRRLLVAAGLTLGATMAVAVAEGIATVSQIGRSFAVASIHVHRGDTVRFSNDDRFDHQLLIESPTFHYESPEQVPGTTKDIVFTTAGTFDVQCEIHPRMHLAVTVD